EQHELRALVRYRDDLLQTRLQQQNRLRDASNAFVRASLTTVLKAIAAQLKDVERQIKTHTAAHTNLQAQVGLLTSIVGVGVVTATKGRAECGDRGKYQSAKAWAADVGVTPSHYESGTTVRRRARMSKIGNAIVRAALYLPALTAMRRCPACKRYAAQLRARG